MENEITAHKAGTIAELPIKEGAPIAAGDTIAVIGSVDGAGAAEPLLVDDEVRAAAAAPRTSPAS